MPANRKYEKKFITDIDYPEENALSELKQELEGKIFSIAEVNKKLRPNDDINGVHTSHEVKLSDQGGKLCISLVFRHRGSSIRFNEDLLDKVVRQSLDIDENNRTGLGLPKKPTKKAVAEQKMKEKLEIISKKV